MLRLHRDHRPTWFKRPTNMVDCYIHQLTGKRLLAANTQSIKLALPPDRLPLPSELLDFDQQGRVILDSRYSQWLLKEGDKNSYTLSLPIHRQLITTQSPLQMLSPSREARYLLDPDLPGQGALLELRTDYPGDVSWSSPTLPIVSLNGKSTARLKPGQHQIKLSDRSGRSVTRVITVEQL
ncbi:MAG: hypothetical protein HKP20_05695 [Akkermansiaceae bacterium]|nr:hypothetical protein [Akkermansiaceae bacterium]